MRVLQGALIALMVAAAPSLKLASVGFKQVGLSDAQATFFSDHLAAKLGEISGVYVTTQSDMLAALGLERQRTLLGCSEESSTCVAELAGALGVDGILTGQVAMVGKRYQLDVKILAANGAKKLYGYSSAL